MFDAEGRRPGGAGRSGLISIVTSSGPTRAAYGSWRAGGDARFGGLYDFLGVGRDYDSDRLVVRFAVVHRERMLAW